MERWTLQNSLAIFEKKRKYYEKYIDVVKM